VAEAISSRHGGFWEIACDLIERHPHNERIRSHLEVGVEQFRHVIAGNLSDHYAGRVSDLEHARDVVATSMPRARAWLEELAARFSRAAEAERKREADERIDW